MFIYEKYWTSQKWKIILESFTLKYVIAEKIENTIYAELYGWIYNYNSNWVIKINKNFVLYKIL